MHPWTWDSLFPLWPVYFHQSLYPPNDSVRTRIGHRPRHTDIINVGVTLLVCGPYQRVKTCRKVMLHCGAYIFRMVRSEKLEHLSM